MKNRAMQYTLVILLCDCVYSTIKACFGLFQVVHQSAWTDGRESSNLAVGHKNTYLHRSPALLKKKFYCEWLWRSTKQSDTFSALQQLLIVLLSFKDLAGVISDANIIVFGSKILHHRHKQLVKTEGLWLFVSTYIHISCQCSIDSIVFHYLWKKNLIDTKTYRNVEKTHLFRPFGPGLNKSLQFGKPRTKWISRSEGGWTLQA